MRQNFFMWLHNKLKLLSAEYTGKALLIFLTGLLFLSSAIAQQTIHQNSQNLQPVDLVFDLDWTLINPTSPLMAKADPKDILVIEGQFYRISNQAVLLLRKLHQFSFVRVSFFSGGKESRNKEAIQLLYQKVNQNGEHFHPYLILSKQDLNVVNLDPQLKFADRYKKELSRFFDVSQTVLIDDIKEFASKGQEKNLIWLGVTYNDLPAYSLRYLNDSREKNYHAPDQKEWARDRNKLQPVQKLITESLAEYKQSQDLSFLQIIERKNSIKNLCQNLFLRM